MLAHAYAHTHTHAHKTQEWHSLFYMYLIFIEQLVLLGAIASVLESCRNEILTLKELYDHVKRHTMESNVNI